jgi:hypothetical protein
MDLGTVIALVIVLNDDLPVRLDDIVVTDGGDEPFALVGGEEIAEVANVFLEGRPPSRRVDEQPSLPFGHVDRLQRIVDAIEVLPVAEVGCSLEGAVQAVNPCVIRAFDDCARHASSLFQELVAPMPANVEEPAESPRQVAHQEHALGADPDCLSVSGSCQVDGSADAYPGLFEEVGLLPVEDVGRRVGRGGKREALPKRCEGSLQRRAVYGRLSVDPHDHTSLSVRGATPHAL